MSEKPKMVLVPETALRPLATIPVANCGTCRFGQNEELSGHTWCSGELATYTQPDFACIQWEPKE